VTDTFKTLGQSNPAATTLVDLYTAPAATQVAGSSLVICNQAASAGSFRIAVRPAGAAINAKHYLAYDTAIDANATIVLDLGITLGATDVVSVYASSANMSFSMFGTEVT
jgi:hypothetical protein